MSLIEELGLTDDQVAQIQVELDERDWLQNRQVEPRYSRREARRQAWQTRSSRSRPGQDVGGGGKTHWPDCWIITREQGGRRALALEL